MKLTKYLRFLRKPLFITFPTLGKGYRPSRGLLRKVMLSIPLIIIIGYLLVLTYVRHIRFSIYNPYQTLIISFLIALSLIPSAVYEYKLEWDVRHSEAEIPVLLSVIESNLRIGLTLPQALKASTEYLTFIKKDVIKLLNAVWVGESIESSLKYFRRDTSLLSVTVDYLRILSRGGEELYGTLRDFRETVEDIVNYSDRLRNATRSYTAILYLVIVVYLITTAVFLKTFIYPLSVQTSKAGGLIAHVSPEPITSLIIYGALIESVINGFVSSYFTGSKYLSSIFHSEILLFMSIITYAALIFTS